MHIKLTTTTAFIFAFLMYGNQTFGQQPGDLDNTFDSDGKVTTDFGANDHGYSVAIQSDGKIVVAGGEANVGQINADFQVARLNSDVVIEFETAVAGEVELAIYNLVGQRLRRLAAGPHVAGVHKARWDGRNDDGRRLATGSTWYVFSVRSRLFYEACDDREHYRILSATSSALQG